MQKQIKSKDRVKEFAEVFTAEREVKAMCDLIPLEIWQDITKVFLEPACGNGNFCEEILKRKLTYCKGEKDGLKALSSIVAIDIQQDNVNECKSRLLKIFIEHFKTVNEFVILLASGILNNNIICGNSLEVMKKWKTEDTVQLSLF